MTPSSTRRPTAATAFAPATVANVSAGFDVLAFALSGVGDRVSVWRDDAIRGVRVESITGVVRELPTDPEQNTASVAVLSLLRATGAAGGFRLAIDKGIALGSGMGGSAASAVAAAVAANRLLEQPLEPEALLDHAVAGERAASGAGHADNAGACLFGGLTAVVVDHPPRVVRLPVPRGIHCALVRPHLRLDTREARAALPESVPLGRHVAQSQRLAGFVAGCFLGDLELVGRSMEDLIAEPARAALIPGLAEARAAAAGAGALAFGIAGAGPSVFAWVRRAEDAGGVAAVVREAFVGAGLATDVWCGPIGETGAVIETAS